MTEKGQIIRCRNCGARNRILPVSKRTPVCGKCKQTLSASASPVTVTDRNFSELVERSSVPVLLDFWAAWCGPCRTLAPIVEELARDLAGKAFVGKLDVDKNQLTAARFRVQSIPTLLIFKNGREADRFVGLQSKTAILQRLERFL